MPDPVKQAALWALAEKFIREQQIRARETVYQADRVIENGYDFIAGVCDIVGYYSDDPEEVLPQ